MYQGGARAAPHYYACVLVIASYYSAKLCKLVLTRYMQTTVLHPIATQPTERKIGHACILWRNHPNSAQRPRLPIPLNGSLRAALGTSPFRPHNVTRLCSCVV
jgi:hypothetical protein